jgi:hypothetical protein
MCRAKIFWQPVRAGEDRLFVACAAVCICQLRGPFVEAEMANVKSMSTRQNQKHTSN